eukprot:3714807-Prymnesium_polylepis.1
MSASEPRGSQCDASGSPAPCGRPCHACGPPAPAPPFTRPGVLSGDGLYCPSDALGMGLPLGAALPWTLTEPSGDG